MERAAARRSAQELTMNYLLLVVATVAVLGWSRGGGQGAANGRAGAESGGRPRSARDASRPQPTSADELAARSQFVFKGTVVRPGASALPEVQATDQTSVVRVDQVMQAPPALGD